MRHQAATSKKVKLKIKTQKMSELSLSLNNFLRILFHKEWRCQKVKIDGKRQGVGGAGDERKTAGLSFQYH